MVEHIQTWTKLGEKWASDERWLGIVETTRLKNPWFTREHIEYSKNAILNQFLDEEKLKSFLANYQNQTAKKKKVGVVCAGNLPLVSFHDIFCTLLSGHQLHLKLSHKDDVLVRYILELLKEVDSEYAARVKTVNRLTEIDAVIATGSDNSHRYFEAYFGKMPHVFRKSRTSIAILDGMESVKEMEALADEILLYFGMGCRNVSKLYVPKDYDFNPLFKASLKYVHFHNHSKYQNNLTYQSSLRQMNNAYFLSNDLFHVVPNESMHAPLSCVFYEHYDRVEDIKLDMDQIQCVFTSAPIAGIKTIKLGLGQQPAIDDFADGIDTMKFLNNL